MTIEDLKDLDRTMFGTMVKNHTTNEIGILLYTWTNSFADGDVPYATCIDKNGKKYNIPMDDISPIEE